MVTDLIWLIGDLIRAMRDERRTRERLNPLELFAAYLLKAKYLRFQRVKPLVILVRDPFDIC
jgi:hypothetical protein